MGGMIKNRENLVFSYMDMFVLSYLLKSDEFGKKFKSITG